MTASNGVKQEEPEKKPGVVRKISKITFTIGPIRQEDLSTPEINKLMAMAQRFDITFDTVPVLDSDQTDKLGYITLPFEIRTQEYLLVLYDRLTNLRLAPNRDVSVKFPEELKKYVEETRQEIHEQKKKKIEEEKQKAEKVRRSVFATWVDKDTGRDSLLEKFPEAKEITVRQHNFQWFGCIEFESTDKALEAMKEAGNKIEIEGQEVKLVRSAPDAVDEKKTPQRSPAVGNRKRAISAGSGGRGMPRGGGVMSQRSPRPLLASGPSLGFGRGGAMGNVGRGGGMGGMGRGMMGAGGFAGGYSNYGGGYSGGYGGNQNFAGGAGNFQLGAKRKSDLGEYGGSPKKPFGSARGGFGGRGRSGW